MFLIEKQKNDKHIRCFLSESIFCSICNNIQSGFCFVFSIQKFTMCIDCVIHQTLYSRPIPSISIRCLFQRICDICKKTKRCYYYEFHDWMGQYQTCYWCHDCVNNMIQMIEQKNEYQRWYMRKLRSFLDDDVISNIRNYLSEWSVPISLYKDGYIVYIPVIDSDAISRLRMRVCITCQKFSYSENLCFDCMDSKFINQLNTLGGNQLTIENKGICHICNKTRMLILFGCSMDMCVDCYKILRSIALGGDIEPYIYLERKPSLANEI